MIKSFALISLALTALTSTTPDVITPEQEAYQFVCDQVTMIDESYTCDGIETPTVIYSTIVRYLQAYGVFIPGEPFVFVDPYGDHVYVTLVHEMAHYVLYYNGLQERCRSEELARFIAGQDAEWRKLYDCEKDNTDARSSYAKGR